MISTTAIKAGINAPSCLTMKRDYLTNITEPSLVGPYGHNMSSS